MQRSDWKMVLVTLLAMAAAMLTMQAEAAGPGAAAAAAPAALVMHDGAALRAAPRDGAPQHTLLWRGDALEVRGERGEFLQVWDHGRERGGYLRRSQVHLLAADAPAAELLAVLAFVRDLPGAEALGLAIGSTFIAAAPPEMLRGGAGATALDAIGQLAERLAERASGAAPQRLHDQAALSAHLDAAQRLGVRFDSREAEPGRVAVCYDGDAWRRVLALTAATPEQAARAALGLTREACAPGATTPTAREQHDLWRAEVLEPIATASLGPWLRRRVSTRRTAVWASLAFARARRGDAEGARAAAERSLAALAEVDKSDLADDELAQYHQSALRANAVRWAAAGTPGGAAASARLRVELRPAGDGQTCVELVDAGRRAGEPLARRCTWGLVWAASASVNRENNALALAVQPADGWRELWVFRKTASKDWTLHVLPPAPAAPGLGYAEFAGWVPGGLQMLVAREAIAEGRTLRRFEVMKLDTLTAERQAFEPGVLGAFARWQDPAWKRASLAWR